MRTYTHGELHAALLAAYAHDTPSGVSASPALVCPYCVPLRGVLGADWRVNVNPESAHFGEVVFEHDWCGCREGDHE